MDYLKTAYDIVEKEKRIYAAQNLPYDTSFIYVFEKALEEKDKIILDSKRIQDKISDLKYSMTYIKQKIKSHQKYYKNLIKYINNDEKTVIFEKFCEILDEIDDIAKTGRISDEIFKNN